jgi:hypothetical protein
MAITAVTSISSSRILQNPGDARAKQVWGFLNAASYPGQWVYYTQSDDKWHLLDEGTAAHRIPDSIVGVVGYHKRLNQTTGALLAITNQYDPANAWDKTAPIIISGFVTAYIADTATNAFGFRLTAGATAGSAKRLVLEDTGSNATTTGSALRRVPIGSIAVKCSSGDTKTIVGIGAFIGDLYVGGPRRAGV